MGSSAPTSCTLGGSGRGHSMAQSCGGGVVTLIPSFMQTLLTLHP